MGGEAQRIRLATQIGSSLVGVLYILDEPSIGLHQRDNERLIATLERLRDLGNTVIVVEHDEGAMRAAEQAYAIRRCLVPAVVVVVPMILDLSLLMPTSSSKNEPARKASPRAGDLRLLKISLADRLLRRRDLRRPLGDHSPIGGPLKRRFSNATKRSR